MAKEAGADIGTSGRWLMTQAELDRLVALVRADERERIKEENQRCYAAKGTSMNIKDIRAIFTDAELALIDSGKYMPGRAVLDAKLDLAVAMEREAIISRLLEIGALEDGAFIESIRARGQA
jgi:hypothetical protein